MLNIHKQLSKKSISELRDIYSLISSTKKGTRMKYLLKYINNHSQYGGAAEEIKCGYCLCDYPKTDILTCTGHVRHKICKECFKINLLRANPSLLTDTFDCKCGWLDADHCFQLTNRKELDIAGDDEVDTLTDKQVRDRLNKMVADTHAAKGNYDTLSHAPLVPDGVFLLTDFSELFSETEFQKLIDIKSNDWLRDADYQEDVDEESRKLADVIIEDVGDDEEKLIILFQRHLKKGPWVQEDSSLHEVVRQGNIDEVKALIETDIDINQWTEKNFDTALKIAFRNNRPDIAKILLDKGAWRHYQYILTKVMNATDDVVDDDMEWLKSPDNREQWFTLINKYPELNQGSSIWHVIIIMVPVRVQGHAHMEYVKRYYNEITGEIVVQIHQQLGPNAEKASKLELGLEIEGDMAAQVPVAPAAQPLGAAAAVQPLGAAVPAVQPLGAEAVAPDPGGAQARAPIGEQFNPNMTEYELVHYNALRTWYYSIEAVDAVGDDRHQVDVTQWGKQWDRYDGPLIDAIEQILRERFDLVYDREEDVREEIRKAKQVVELARPLVVGAGPAPVDLFGQHRGQQAQRFLQPAQHRRRRPQPFLPREQGMAQFRANVMQLPHDGAPQQVGFFPVAPRRERDPEYDAEVPEDIQAALRRFGR